jgi:Phage ORF5 protein
VIYKIVAIRDRAIDTYSVPSFVPNVGAAVRGFGDEIKRPHTDERPNQLNLHPEDFDMFLMGTYDDQSGLFDSQVPKQIAIGKDYL